MKVETVEEFLKRGGKITVVPAQTAAKFESAKVNILKAKGAKV